MAKEKFLVVGSASESEALSGIHNKALRNIVFNGDDRALGAKCWKQIKVDLFRVGLLRRRIGDWAWVPVQATRRTD